MEQSDFLHKDPTILKSLAKLPLFKLLDGERIAKIVGFCKIHKYKEGETIIAEGDKDTALYILLQGGVRILKLKKKIGDLHRFGDIFGEVNLFDGYGRSATVRADSEVICLVLESAKLESLAPEDIIFFHALVYRALAEVLSRKLRETSKDVAELKSNKFFAGDPG